MNLFALNEPLVLRNPYLGRMSNDEFFNFCQAYRELRIERNEQGGVRSPDASGVSAGRWNALTAAQQDKFVQVCPEFVVELRSKTGLLRVLLAKMVEYRPNGALLGWLLSCDDERAHIFGAGQEGHEILAGFDRELTGEAVLPSLRVNLRKLR